MLNVYLIKLGSSIRKILKFLKRFRESSTGGMLYHVNLAQASTTNNWELKAGQCVYQAERREIHVNYNLSLYNIYVCLQRLGASFRICTTSDTSNWIEFRALAKMATISVAKFATQSWNSLRCWAMKLREGFRILWLLITKAVLEDNWQVSSKGRCC